MFELLTLEIDNGIATITLDDGKNNLVTPKLLRELNSALDKVEASGSVLIITGREEVLSAGFDLQVIKHGVTDAFAMLIGGFKLCGRLMGFRTPVIIANNGHAVAMGCFLLLSGDYRIGVDGDYKIMANEVAIGLTIPSTAAEVCRYKLKPGHFDRAVLMSESYSPQAALDAGFLDKVVDREKLMDEARKVANSYLELDLKAHYRSKLKSRKQLLRKLKWAVRADRVEIARLGLLRVLGK